jgi:multicomponent Na+:H+ antiporter subunit B
VSRRLRFAVFAAGILLLGGILVWAVADLPRFGDFHGRLGRTLAHDSVRDRGGTNSVVVTTFDYRGVDTLIEEFILFISVVGVTVLLRIQRGEEQEPEEEPEEAQASEAMRWGIVGLVGPVALLALYVVTHGALTPGGGFQGGVVLMTSILLVFLSGQYVLTELRGHTALEVVHGAGAVAFAMIAFGGLVAGAAFFHNFIAPHGTALLAGGTIPLSNLSVGLEVMGATLLVLTELLDQRFLRPPR